jgi:hypothetical protein
MADVRPKVEGGLLQLELASGLLHPKAGLVLLPLQWQLVI